MGYLDYLRHGTKMFSKKINSYSTYGGDAVYMPDPDLVAWIYRAPTIALLLFVIAWGVSRRRSGAWVVGLVPAVIFYFFLQEVDEASGGEDRGTAGSGVDQFFSGVQIFPGDVGQRFGFVLQVMERTLHHPLVLPREAAIENRGITPLFASEGAGLVGAVMVDDGQLCRLCH